MCGSGRLCPLHAQQPSPCAPACPECPTPASLHLSLTTCPRVQLNWQFRREPGIQPFQAVSPQGVATTAWSLTSQGSMQYHWSPGADLALPGSLPSRCLCCQSRASAFFLPAPHGAGVQLRSLSVPIGVKFLSSLCPVLLCVPKANASQWTHTFAQSTHSHQARGQAHKPNVLAIGSGQVPSPGSGVDAAPSLPDDPLSSRMRQRVHRSPGPRWLCCPAATALAGPRRAVRAGAGPPRLRPRLACSLHPPSPTVSCLLQARLSSLRQSLNRCASAFPSGFAPPEQW